MCQCIVSYSGIVEVEAPEVSEWPKNKQVVIANWSADKFQMSQTAQLSNLDKKRFVKLWIRGAPELVLRGHTVRNGHAHSIDMRKKVFAKNAAKPYRPWGIGNPIVNVSIAPKLVAIDWKDVSFLQFPHGFALYGSGPHAPGQGCHGTRNRQHDHKHHSDAKT
jgi:hypothetical protein